MKSVHLHSIFPRGSSLFFSLFFSVSFFQSLLLLYHCTTTAVNRVVHRMLRSMRYLYSSGTDVYSFPNTTNSVLFRCDTARVTAMRRREEQYSAGGHRAIVPYVYAMRSKPISLTLCHSMNGPVLVLRASYCRRPLSCSVMPHLRRSQRMIPISYSYSYLS